MKPLVALAAFTTLAAQGGVWAAPDQCANAIQEFALLAQMDMRDEALRQYSRLNKECKVALRASAGNAALPASGKGQAIMAFGKGLYQNRKAGSSQQRSTALKGADIPEVDANALAGVGPENATRALSGMALDVLTAAAGSRNKFQEKNALSKLADRVRGDERKWVDSGSSSGTGGGSSSVPSTPDQPIALPDDLVQKASCDGDFSFLLPLLRGYQDPMLAQLRQSAGSGSVRAAIESIRRQGFDKARALKTIQEQARAYDQTSAEAAVTANQTDGYGEVSIPKARADQLPLSFSCSEGIHASGVCGYISSRWSSLVARAHVPLVERCW